MTVHVTNDGDLKATVHWHGLRLENKYDGVPHETQTPIPVGGSFTYRIRFPDPGLYWYHPHIREDYTQEMGLYGNILVVPADPGYWPPADRDVLLTLDDLLLEDGKIARFSPVETTYTAMGRFGNVLLVSGEPDCSLTVKTGEVVRLWLTNTANTRVFNVQLPGARMKLIGGDSGRVEHEEFVSEVILAPSERAVVDVGRADRHGAHHPGRPHAPDNPAGQEPAPPPARGRQRRRRSAAGHLRRRVQRRRADRRPGRAARSTCSSGSPPAACSTTTPSPGPASKAAPASAARGWPAARQRTLTRPTLSPTSP